MQNKYSLVNQFLFNNLSRCDDSDLSKDPALHEGWDESFWEWDVDFNPNVPADFRDGCPEGLPGVGDSLARHVGQVTTSSLDTAQSQGQYLRYEVPQLLGWNIN